jgi:hypothetical protein
METCLKTVPWHSDSWDQNILDFCMCALFVGLVLSAELSSGEGLLPGLATVSTELFRSPESPLCVMNTLKELKWLDLQLPQSMLTRDSTQDN